MPLTVKLEPWSLPDRQTPPEFAPPPLSQIDTVLAERRRFLDQRGRRSALVQLLLGEHRAQGAPAASLRNIERLAQNDCFAVVTGQQPTLLTGPLYTFWKILTAILLAERLERERPESYVPVFWNAGEDHDTAEMDHFHWLDRQGQLTAFHLDPPEDDRPTSFGARPMTALDAQRLLAFWDETLVETEFSPLLKAAVREASCRAATLGEFFNQILWQLLPDSGLVILNSFYRSYPQLALDLLGAEIEQPLRSNALVNDAGDQLRARHFKPQMHRASGRCSFFIYEQDARVPLHFSEGSFIGAQTTYPPEALVDRLRRCPGDFSAAANLRPILQDALLPTAVNILGPGEFAYHLQLKPLYAHHRVPQPAAARRLQLSLLPPRVSNGLAKLRLSPDDLRQPLTQLRKGLAARQSPARAVTLCEQLQSQIRDTLAQLRREVQCLDKSLNPLIIGHEKQLLAQVDKLQNRIAARSNRQDHQAEQLLDRLHAALWPNGLPQERVLNLFYFLNLFGEQLTPALTRQLTDADLEGAYLARLKHGT